jgi:hypothetical protein
VGPRAGLDGCGKSRPQRYSIPGPSSPYRVALPTALSRPTKRIAVSLFNDACRTLKENIVDKFE